MAEVLEGVDDSLVDSLAVGLAVDINLATVHVLVVKGDKLVHRLKEQPLGRVRNRRPGSRRRLVAQHDSLYFDVGGKIFECSGRLDGRREGVDYFIPGGQRRIWPQAQALGCECGQISE